METTPDGPPLEDPLALEQQVCFALAVASRNVIGVTARSWSRWVSPTRSTS